MSESPCHTDTAGCRCSRSDRLQELDDTRTTSYCGMNILTGVLGCILSTNVLCHCWQPDVFPCNQHVAGPVVLESLLCGTCHVIELAVVLDSQAQGMRERKGGVVGPLGDGICRRCQRFLV